MTTGPDLAIRRLTAADAPACDEIVRSLPYHFGDPDGRRECAEAVRRSAGLVAVREGRVIGFLTVAHHFEAASEITWMAVHADHRDRGVGRALIRRLTGDKALLLVMPLDAQAAAADGAAIGP